MWSWPTESQRSCRCRAAATLRAARICDPRRCRSSSMMSRIIVLLSPSPWPQILAARPAGLLPRAASPQSAPTGCRPRGIVRPWGPHGLPGRLRRSHWYFTHSRQGRNWFRSGSLWRQERSCLPPRAVHVAALVGNRSRPGKVAAGIRARIARRDIGGKPGEVARQQTNQQQKYCIAPNPVDCHP